MEIKHNKYVFWSTQNKPEKISGKIKHIIPNMDKHTGLQKISRNGLHLWFIVLEPRKHQYDELWIQINDNQRKKYYQYHIDEEGTFIHEGSNLQFLEGIFEDTEIGDYMIPAVSEEVVSENVEKIAQKTLGDYISEVDDCNLNLDVCRNWIEKEISDTREKLGILERIKEELL